MNFLRVLTIGGLVTAACSGAIAQAETVTSGDLAFQQLPLNGGLAPGGAPYNGHANLSTATAGGFLGLQYSGTYLADDFALSSSDPIVHVEWWGSYLAAGNGGGVQQFLISFETDVPATGDTPSHPGASMISQVVTRGELASQSGTFTETAIASAGGQLYRYNAELSLPVLHAADAVYWLKIVALVSPTSEGDLQWAWQNRDYSIDDALAPGSIGPGEHQLANSLGEDIWHFQGDAMTGAMTGFLIIGSPIMVTGQQSFAPVHYVDGTDGPTGISAFGQDMAFALYTQPPAAVPEPSAWVLLATAGAMLLAVSRRRRR